MTAPARGRAAIAGGIQEFSDVTGRMALQMQEARNTAAIADADRLMREKTDEYLDSLAEQPDYSKWVSDFQTQVPAVQQAVFQKFHGRGLGPEVTRKLELAFKDWGQRTTAQIHTLATRAEVKDTRSSIQLSSSKAAEQGDELGAMAPFDSPGAKHVFTPTEITAFKDDVGRQVDHYAARHGAMKDPRGTLELLKEETEGGKPKNFKRLTVDDRDVFERECRARISQERVDTFQGLGERMAAGETIPERELNDLVKAKRLTQTEAKRIQLEQRRSEKDPELPAQYAKLLTAADEYDPGQDPTNEQYATLMGETLGLPSNLQTEVHARLTAARKSPTGSKDPEAFKYITQLGKNNFLGDRAETLPGKPKNKAAYLKSFELELELRESLKHYLANNPKASMADQVKFIQEQAADKLTIAAISPGFNPVLGRATTPPATPTSSHWWQFWR